MNATNLQNDLLRAAIAYLEHGLVPLPAIRIQKRPALSGWKAFQRQPPSEQQLRTWFSDSHDAVCIVTGTVSGNLEMLDFDRGGDRFASWSEMISAELFAKFTIETSQSGGRHVIYRCDEPVCGNMKLAMGYRDGALVTLIETRGEGGLFLCAPTTGYTVAQGSLTELPRLSSRERDLMLEAAWSLNEHLPSAEIPSETGCVPENRPGDDFNNRGDVREILVRHGWTLAKQGENEYWRRPGKQFGWSATLKDRTFYVFSSNAAPFDPNRGYSPFAVFAWLEHGGDFELAARSLRHNGFGGDLNLMQHFSLTEGSRENHSEGESLELLDDPGTIPDELLRVPGFVSEVMDHCLATAPYPNHVMAFCGALALQAFLAGRKVRDPGDNRTNLYLLGLAHSAAGKDWPRKLNSKILFEIGAAGCLGERFSSGEGIQDALFLTPSMLFQTDEIDGMLQSMNKSRDARHENVMSTLLTLFSTSNSVFPMRRKAGKDSPGAIDQPNLIIFGTAIPNHYYEALSERMLTNGFFARMIILECGQRGSGQEPRIIDLPDRVLETARWWNDFQPGTGNLQTWHPVPVVVPQAVEARSLLSDARDEADGEYRRSEQSNDSVGTTVWGRVNEQIRKLALIYAVSEDARDPQIGVDAAQWAIRFVMHQTRRMLFMASNHVAENPFHSECLRMLRKIREAPDQQLEHSVLLKRMKMATKNFQDLITSLEQQKELVTIVNSTAGRPQRLYKLLRETRG